MPLVNSWRLWFEANVEKQDGKLHAGLWIGLCLTLWVRLCFGLGAPMCLGLRFELWLCYSDFDLAEGEG